MTTSDDNKISAKSFAFLVLKQLNSLTHYYKDTVYGCIQALHENYGYSCDASDDEIYGIVMEASKRLM